MIELICSKCKTDWKDFGYAWKRHDNSKIDYYCSNCQSKRKPIRNELVVFGYPNVDNNGYMETDKIPTPMLDSLTDVHTWTTGGIMQRTVPENILVIGDLHLPFTLDGYLDFCKSIFDKYKCDHVIFMGDIIDSHYSSFHNSDPDGLSAGDELDFAIQKIKAWKKVFPIADVCLGNHDQIILRKAFSSGVSKRWIKDFKDVLGVNWTFEPHFIYNNILFRHGIGMKSAPKAGSEFMNIAQGHHHTSAYVEYRVGMGSKFFGMQVPCGIDHTTYAMAYAREFAKPAIGCGVILDHGRTPIIEMMDL